ncbi:MAG: hypothetical protein JOY99_15110 [Sphingomonadaceae bacterium]|nr:hypothetical protein [Sphingomonadaceae bacterium]
MTAHSRIQADGLTSPHKRLIGYQDRIEALLARAEMALAARGKLDAGEIGHIRWELARLLSEYQIFKHVRLFDPLIAQGGPRSAAAAAMKESCVAVGEAFRAHVLKWGAAAILDRPAAYRAATMVEIARLRTHLKRERDGVRTLLKA